MLSILRVMLRFIDPAKGSRGLDTVTATGPGARTNSSTGSQTNFASGVFLTFALVAGLSGSLAAQTFKPNDPLFFTKPFGGANPLPQILNISSTGAAFSFTATASTSTGGSWLSVSPSGFCCTTPSTVQVIVNATVSLAAGTYNGQVVFSAGANTLTVPVTFVVAAPGATFFDNLPGGLSFTAKTGVTSFTSQPLNVRNGGQGTLNWSVTATTFDNGPWLNVSNGSGTAPSFVTIGINAANLPNAGQVAGVFDGMLQFSGAGSTITVPISVTVGANVFEQMNGLSFTKPFAGQDPLPQFLQAASTGTAFTLTASAVSATGGDWITVSPSGFCCTTPAAVSVSVNPAITLAAGVYTAQVFLTSATTSIVIPVSLTVAPAGSTFLDNMAGQLSFTVKTGGSVSPPAQVIQVRNGGTGVLSWTLVSSTFDNVPWLNVSATTGTAPSYVSVSISVASLPDGGLISETFSGQLLFQDANSSVTVPISVVVSAGAAFEQINGLTFTKPFSGANPLPQTITAASIGSAFSFTASAYSATGGSWLTVSPSGFCCTTPAVLSVGVNPAITLAAGTYTGEVALTSGSTAIVVPVTLIIGDPTTAFFDNMAGQLSFSLNTGAGNPPVQQIQVRSGGSGSLDWTASATTSDSGNWLTVAATSGTAPSTVTVGIVAANLPNAALIAGTFTGEIRFLSGNNTATVPISVAVGGNSFAQVNPIAFTKTFGGANPLPQTLTMTSLGAAFSFTATASAGTGGNWLTVTPSGFCCTTPAVVTVAVNPAVTLAAGTYTGEVVLNTASQAVTVPVTLTVAPAGGTVFDNEQGQMSFSSPVGGTSLTSQPITIRNAGSGTLSWDVVASTFDNGNWLTVSSPSGTAPSTVTVGIVPGNLPNLGLVAGNYTGQLLFRSSSGNITVPISVELGPNVFVQRDGLTFTKAFGSPSPLTQTVTVSSTGTNFSYTATASSGNGGNWLTVTPSGFCCTTQAVNTASVNASAAFPGGTYTGQLVFNQGTRAMTVPVTLVVTGGATLSIAKTHTGNFMQGQNGATYSVTVSNPAGAGPTSGVVTVTETVPSGLTLMSMAGTGWTCPGTAANNCSRSDTLNGGASYPAITVTVNVAANATSPQTNQVSVSGGGSATATASDPTPVTAPQALRFVPITPCRIADTRNATGPFGGPIIAGGTSRDFTVPSSACSIPSTAQAYSLNVAVVPATTLGYLTLWPTGQTRPLASTLNSLDGRIKSNAAIVPAGTGGAVSVFVSDTTQVILDINGYFVPATDPTGLAFYPITPCRIADTRTAAAPLGGPSLVGGQNRTFPILSSTCNLPATAQAYSLNFAAVPSGSLGYLTAWPTGQARPLAASLNALTGAVTANAAIVPAGTGGSIDVFASNTTNLVIDINGYFAPMGTGGLSLYGVTPCRVVDTRQPVGSPPISSLDVAVSASACGIPATAQAHVLSVTVVPPGSLGYLTLWPQGQTRPVVSTLNALDGAITSNLAIVPTNNGTISAFASNPTHLVIDISGYFAQ